MNTLLRFAACAAALVVAFYGLNFLQPGWVGDVGPALVSLTEFRTRMGREAESIANLDDQDKTIMARIQAKSGIARDAAGGRLTLWEAAVKLRNLDRDLSEAMRAAFRRHSAGRTDDERYAYRVIALVEAELRDWPAVAAEVGARLRAELRAALEQGEFHLPE